MHKSGGQGHALSPTPELRPWVLAFAKNPVRYMDTQVNSFPSKDFYVSDASRYPFEMTVGHPGFIRNLSWEVNVLKCILQVSRGGVRGGRKGNLAIEDTNPTHTTPEELERNRSLGLAQPFWLNYNKTISFLYQAVTCTKQ